MKSNLIFYDFEKSRARIDEILKAEDSTYEELDSIPSRDNLTYSNGFYVYCSALFVDIRKSSELTKKYNRPTLAKIYRSFISEVVAIINGNIDCAEVNIEGDCVWGIFDTPKKADFDVLFSTVAKLSSIIDLLNLKFIKKNITPILVGIGLSYGRALMLKAGYNGSGINDIIWMGDVVNETSKLCSFGNSTYLDKELMVSNVFQQNINEQHKTFLEYNYNRGCYHGCIVNIDMEKWIDENRNK